MHFSSSRIVYFCVYNILWSSIRFAPALLFAQLKLYRIKIKFEIDYAIKPLLPSSAKAVANALHMHRLLLHPPHGYAKLNSITITSQKGITFKMLNHKNLLPILLIVFTLTACGTAQTADPDTTSHYSDEAPATSTFEANPPETDAEADSESPQTEADHEWDRIPMVMVNDKLYYDTGRESTIELRCGNMDGEITSSVDGTQVPTQNNESNFGSGFGFQYGREEDTIEVYMNEKWIVFEYRDGADE